MLLNGRYTKKITLNIQVNFKIYVNVTFKFIIIINTSRSKIYHSVDITKAVEIVSLMNSVRVFLIISILHCTHVLCTRKLHTFTEKWIVCKYMQNRFRMKFTSKNLVYHFFLLNMYYKNQQGVNKKIKNAINLRFVQVFCMN